MPKSMLVIDTPKSCSECKYNVGFGEGFLCSANYSLREDNKTTQRHPQCPLQDTSELLEAIRDIETHISINNAMIYGDAQKWKEDKIMYSPFTKLYKALDWNVIK